ncbi:hypothetical protein [Fibrella forsythiae]|uniref:Uncharacterized protein n=1 Tax=Fibrella forsythiae TaxID=2817061 RepID=A0ABS3JH92_9BACT|nr:hypothetical protein [Fibrella forsythiae]MBO0948778.1 hypothetical protein [Fibrella forsythiae]
MSAQTYAQDAVETAKQYLTTNAQKQKLSQSDIGELITSSAYLSPTTGWYHVYFNQGYQSIDVYNRLMNVVIKDGQVAYMTHNFIPDLIATKSTALSKTLLTPAEALQRAAAHLSLPVVAPARLQELSVAKLVGQLECSLNLELQLCA